MAVATDATKQGTPFGRPTSYRPEYCQMLVDHMKEGLSFESFAGVIGVSRATIYNWTKEHEDFLDARSQGQDLCRLWWERAGKAGMFMGGQGNPFQASIWIFNMKARFREDWGETRKVELTGKIETVSPEAVREELQSLKDMLKEEVEG